MGLINESHQDIDSPPVFIEIHSDYKGGGTFDNTGIAGGTLIRKGAFVNFNEDSRMVTLQKTAKIVEAADNTATSYKIAKQVNNQAHLLQKGDVVAVVKGGKSYAISADINTSNSDYDVITVGTTLGVEVAIGDVLFHSAASGATAGALKVAVNGQLRNDLVVSKNDFVAVVRQGINYNRRLPFPSNDVIKDALKGLIIFSEQR